jgi:hypothetical protein
MAEVDGLLLSLELPGPLVAGIPALAVLRVANRSPEPQLVSARLNLMEGDLALRIFDPDGGIRDIKGWQADTGLHRIELPPQRELVGAITLLETPEGELFPRPGGYRLQAEYIPAPTREAVAAAPVEVEVVSPGEEERALAERLQDPQIRRALLLADLDGGTDRLAEIARGFPGSYAAILARLLLEAELPQGLNDIAIQDPINGALAVLALNNPYSSVGERLTKIYSEGLERGKDGAGPLTALRILKHDPLPAGTPLMGPGAKRSSQ